MAIKISEILGTKTVVKASNRGIKISIGLLITGILSLILVLVTFYGQYTGTYLIAVTKDAALKGIAISESSDFVRSGDELQFLPLNDIEDTVESLVMLKLEEAENTDGQFHEEGQQFVAYTFYLKNIGQEAVNVNYQIRVVDDIKGLGMATFIKVREYEFINEPRLLTDENYSKVYSDSQIIANVNILNFKPGDIRKFTFFIWFDGEYSDPSMLGGSLKLDWVFSITSAEEVVE